ncbi:IS110 family transposase [Blastococcus brunescens]|uniref:IS110 family transposase n=2 Tax=Blastococcus brunescens TaxID=1564165 RepID=A0ABZ1B6B1_9ACTN|nr:IS110 family transposase [Blastococcus sp. BMG 8361]WRL66343.1 IS110 family transposase [Blastococcus sp. BMG 8361]
MTRRFREERLRVGAPLTQIRGLPDREPLPGLSDMCGEAPMGAERTSVGLDVHARSVSAAAIDGVTGELIKQRLVPDPRVVLDWVHDLPAPAAVTYEAGPTGFGLARALAAAGIRCEVAAPSKINRPPGDRIKTDARDAVLLARLLRLDDIVAVRVPTVAQESARDLVRAREDARGDLMRVRHRLSKLLLRHGHVYSGGAAWTGKHEQWLRQIRFDGRGRAGTQAAYAADLEALTLTVARRDRLDEQITALAADSEFTPVTWRLCCLRGISTLTGFSLAVEIGDWSRFTGASIGAYLGLIPSEHSSGNSRRQGAITKTGNSHVRRLLVEAAWHHQPAYRIGPTMRARWDQATPAARVRGHAGNQRLHDRWVQLSSRNKKHTVACVAIARELAGWCWSLATLPDA